MRKSRARLRRGGVVARIFRNQNPDTGDSMFQTKVTFWEDQTPEQRKAHAANCRREDARRRAINNAFGFWRICSKPVCRRNRTCSHDMHACFERQWGAIPEDQKEWLRGAIVAMNNGATDEAVARAGDARRAEYLQMQERLNARTAPASSPGAAHGGAAPAADDTNAPPPARVRIRQL
jgi:hypothetical protein